MRNVSRVLVAVLVVSLGGCSGDLATRPMPSKSPSSSPSPSDHATPAGPSAADRRYLRQSVRSLLAGESVEFVFAHRYGEEAFLQGSGTAALAPIRWAATATSNAAAFGVQRDPATFHVRSFRNVMWMQMEDWPEPSRGCWLQLEGHEVPLAITSMRAGQPVYVSALASLRAGALSGDTMTAQITLDQALNLLPGRIGQAVDLDQDTAMRSRVPVDLVFRERVLSSLTMHGPVLLDALAEAGAGTPDDVLADFAPAFSIRVDYSEATGTEPSYLPPAGTVVHVGDEGC